MLSIKTILWPTDESKSSLHALEAALELAEKFKAKLYALQVVSQVQTIPETGFASATMYTSFDVSRYEQELVKTAQNVLEQTVAEKVPKSIEVESFVKMGWPPDVIVNFAREKGVGLIVMATHGRSGMAHLMMGSVTERTIRQSPVPVLAIPWEGKEKKQG